MLIIQCEYFHSALFFLPLGQQQPPILDTYIDQLLYKNYTCSGNGDTISFNSNHFDSFLYFIHNFLFFQVTG